MSFVDAVLGDPNPGTMTPELRRGVVTQVSPLMVTVGSSSVPQPCSALEPCDVVVGEAVSVLVLSGDRVVLGPTVTAPVSVKADLGATQSIPANTYTPVTWTLEVSDPFGFISPPGIYLVVPPGRGGFYLITVRAFLPSSFAGQFELVVDGIPFNTSWTSGLTSPSMTLAVSMNPGSTIGLFVAHQASGPATISFRMPVVRVGPY